MASPSILGDLGYQVSAVFPLSTSTTRYFARNSGTDTGTIVTTSRALDLSRALHVGTTGGKPLDATVHPRAAAAPRFKSLAVAVPLELNFHDSGLQVFPRVRHWTRAASAGAGSTWELLKTDIRRFKMGTDTDAVFHTGFVSSINTQAIKRFWKANIDFLIRKGSSTAAKDTTTASSPIICNSPVVILSGADAPQVSVPAVV